MKKTKKRERSFKKLISEKLFFMPIVGKPMKNGGRFLSMRVKFTLFMILTALVVLALAFSAIPMALQIFRREHSRPDRVAHTANLEWIKRVESKN